MALPPVHITDIPPVSFINVCVSFKFHVEDPGKRTLVDTTVGIVKEVWVGATFSKQSLVLSSCW